MLRFGDWASDGVLGSYLGLSNLLLFCFEKDVIVFTLLVWVSRFMVPDKVLSNNQWNKHVVPISTDTEIKDFVALWEEITKVLSNTNNEDQSTWRCTSDREYTTSSMYNILFIRN